MATPTPGEPIPGLAGHIRSIVERRVRDNHTLRFRASQLTAEQIYRLGPTGAIERVAAQRPADPADLGGWERYNTTYVTTFTTPVVNEWVARIRKEHAL